MAEKIYKNDSIKSIDARTFTRLRAGVYCGSTEYSTQLLRELFSNALDEHNIGHGNNIIVKIDTKKNEYTVIDEAQGFPVGVLREDKETVLQASFDVLNTSGKYDEDGVYGASALGVNGIGNKLVNFLSLYLVVSSTNKTGKKEVLWLKDGIFEKREYQSVDKTEHGTSVTYKPDPQFFQHAEVDLNDLKKLFEDISALCPGLFIKLYIDDKEIIYHSKNGIADLVDKKIKDNEIISQRFQARKIKNDNLFDICLTYTKDYSENLTSYVNYGLTESGVHLQTLRSGLTREFNKYANDNGLLKKNEANLTGQELSEGLVLVCNLKANGVQYDSQTKVRVVDIDRSLINETISEDFALWLTNNPKDAKIIIDKALAARRAREAAQKARERAREGNVKGLKAKMQLSDKFIDCTSKNPADRNLVLVEGLSAGSSAIEARNVKTDCIYMLRGKILSTLGKSMDTILANQELSVIVKVIGAVIGDKFDVNKMQFDKIVITSDADADGDQIALLLITFFFTYMKPLVESGKLYRAITLLYICRKTGQKEQYFYTDNEYKTWAQANPGWDIIRNKGLGELNSQDLHDVCFKNQNFKRLTVDDCTKVEQLLNILEGSSANLRKQYIYDNATHLGFDFD